MNLKRRLEKLEGKIGSDLISGARALVHLEVFVTGELPEDTDIEAMTAKYAREGKTLKKLLDEIDGTSLGLPSERYNPDGSLKENHYE
ncbi:MAG: hypothetical protein M0P57_14995 [Syntrophales bacterium]|nr:hypothetical protein [Syntrophales bacterium]